MAADKGSKQQVEEEKSSSACQNGSDAPSPSRPAAEEEEDDEEEEPRLKYAPLTKSLTALYRNGDATSAFLVSGDKLIVGTHNGATHVLSLPTFQSLRAYRAQAASISSVSISPFPPPLPSARLDHVHRVIQQSPSGHGRSPSTSSEAPGSKATPRQAQVPPSPSNQIYIATSSIDGTVCISSLIDAKDVQLRNFGRPVQAVALSPDYKNDKTFLSGGIAGSLILTVGGQAGKSNATTTGTAAAASGWLGSIGLGASTGTDKVLHSGEGTISTIKWSLSGNYVLWVNEHGIKIMRSHLHLESAGSGLEWKRVSHIDRPNRSGWEDMASVWKARAEWVDRANLETEGGSALEVTKSRDGNGRAEELLKNVTKKNKPEEAIVGWGGTVWMLKVFPGGVGSGKNIGEKNVGTVEVATILRFDCIISGISLYTPSLLLVLAYTEADQDQNSANDTPSKKGRHHRQNALEPELRLIDITSKPEEEISADTLTISRYESLSSSDYHLGVLPPLKIPAAAIQKGALETIGTGLWDATLYPTRMFSSSASMMSGRSGEEKGSFARASSGQVSAIPANNSRTAEIQNVATTQGMKIFIMSPYDCVVAVKRDLSDRLSWLTKMQRYQEAWELLDQHPEAASSTSESSESSSPKSPSKAGSVSSLAAGQIASTSLQDFFADSVSTTSLNRSKGLNSVAEKEKRRIGELWLQQLVSANEWSTAGDVAGKVLNTSQKWEHWAWIFIKNQKFDEITPSIPTFHVTPPLPSTIYEIILGHYIQTDRRRFKELLDLWPTDLFDINSVVSAIEEQLKSKSTRKDSDEWRFLKEGLAKLFIADGRYEDALRCYIQVQDAETALTMIKEYHLLSAISDDIPNLVSLRVSEEQLEKAPLPELEEATSEPIKILVKEAYSGTVMPSTVVDQLQRAKRQVFLYFYFRALWRGEEGKTVIAPRIRHGRVSGQTTLATEEGKGFVDDYADLAVRVFAEYDRDLLMEYLHASTAYTFDNAVKICEEKRYTQELVYLLSKTGQTKKALFLIINDLRDVSQAIAFAKEQDDPDLWDDLLEYSMSRPRFIEGLLSEVGTAIDPITLIKRIPSGLEIEGLRDGLQKMIREYDLQHSISAGAAKVLHSEVATGMEILRKGRNKGLRFDVPERPSSRDSVATVRPEITTSTDANEPSATGTEPKPRTNAVGAEPGHCAACDKAFTHDESEPLVIFACHHSYHLSHLLSTSESTASTPKPSAENDISSSYFATSTSSSRTVGAKVTNARLLREKIQSVGGCRICQRTRFEDDGAATRPGAIGGLERAQRR